VVYGVELRWLRCGTRGAFQDGIVVEPIVKKEGEAWVVRLERGGKLQEYRCASEAQARSLVAALMPRPG
jgi:hypothetical protein